MPSIQESSSFVKKPKVLITRHWPASVEEAMQAVFDVTLNKTDVPLNAVQLRQAFSEYDAICPCVTDSLPAELLSGNKIKTKILANYGVGFNHIDVAAMKAQNIVVTNTPDVLTDATADLAMTLMLMVARRAGPGERQVRNNKWAGWYPTHLMGTMITGKTLGIIGMGRIGQAMACKAQHGFNMDILYHNRKPLDASVLAQDKLDATYCAQLKDLLERSDYVAIHCPGGEKTRHLMNAKTFAEMKPEAFIINTARGDVIDEKALIAALNDGIIAGAGLDVYEAEPSVPKEFMEMENVVLLPHLGSATLETRTAMGMRAFENLNAFFNNKQPLDLL